MANSMCTHIFMQDCISQDPTPQWTLPELRLPPAVKMSNNSLSAEMKCWLKMTQTVESWWQTYQEKLESLLHGGTVFPHRGSNGLQMVSRQWSNVFEKSPFSSFQQLSSLIMCSVWHLGVTLGTATLYKLVKHLNRNYSDCKHLYL